MLPLFCYGILSLMQHESMEDLIRFQEENPNYWGDQDENGVDLARLRENLKLTPAERIQRNDQALQALRQMEHARGRSATLTR